MLQYISTRGQSKAVSSHQAVLDGLAPDGGLYIASQTPSPFKVEDFAGLTYAQSVVKVLSVLLDDYCAKDLEACVEAAYDEKFDTQEIVPVKKGPGLYLMELWHGPTSAFKDMALTLLPHLLTCAMHMENRTDEIAILTATSGDTGKAALSGFADVAHTSVTVFYPEIGVSPIQKRQMVTSEGRNVEVIAVKGNFDDCQRLVKRACSSPEVKAVLKGVSISSANSINVGRLSSQVPYYFSTYSRLVRSGSIRMGDLVDFVVPTGNFGDILAGYLAKKMGLPVGKLVCASNSNHVLTDFFHTGTYQLDRPFYATMSSSMDILISSNLERLLYMESGGDADLTASLMKQLEEKGTYTVPEKIMDSIRDTFEADWTTEDETNQTMHEYFQQTGTLIDPHTAVAVHAAWKRGHNGTVHPTVVLSTASPYKFPKDVLRAAAGEEEADDFAAMERLEALSGQKAPEALKSLKEKPVRFTRSITIEEGIQTVCERMRELSAGQEKKDG